MDINSWDKETHISTEVVRTISELNVECQLFVNKGTIIQELKSATYIT